MTIREIKLKKNPFEPGENLSQKGGEYTHVTITYNISGDREKIDRHILKILENESGIQKINEVNTTLYWQDEFGDEKDDEDELNIKVKNKIKKKLLEIFVNKNDLSHETVTAFCTVGNIRAFCFELSA